MMTKTEVAESTEYDGCLDIEKRPVDGKPAKLFESDEDAVTKLIKDTKKKSGHKHVREIYVHFESMAMFTKFMNLLDIKANENIKEVDFSASVLFGGSNIRELDEKEALVKHDEALLFCGHTLESPNYWPRHWYGMPEFEQEEKKAAKSIKIKFKTEADVERFEKMIDQDIGVAKSIWHPKLEITQNKLLRWFEQTDKTTNPRHPVYIVSKGRADSMYTSRSLARMKVPHYIAIEPQDEEDYDKALDTFDIREYVTLLILPFSNHGDGPGRARNWCWDHSMTIGADAHWVMDDNINDFYRLHQNQRIRVESGCLFKACENFVDRYDNVPVSGLQYRFFIAPNQKYPPFVTNTRIYSCLLIKNDCKHRWRGRYNEDTDLSLRVLKDGDCTIQFNFFLQGKAATQTLKGGNTEEFYHTEYVDEEDVPTERKYHEKGTINKSQMLEDMHPDVAWVVWKYDRWHHHVNYLPFKKNALRVKKDANLMQKADNYGLKLIKFESVDDLPW